MVPLILGNPHIQDCKLQKYRPEVGKHMSYSLNSLKGGYIGDYIGDYYRAY